MLAEEPPALVALAAVEGAEQLLAVVIHALVVDVRVSATGGMAWARRPARPVADWSSQACKTRWVVHRRCRRLEEAERYLPRLLLWARELGRGGGCCGGLGPRRAVEPRGSVVVARGGVCAEREEAERRTAEETRRTDEEEREGWRSAFEALGEERDGWRRAFEALEARVAALERS